MPEAVSTEMHASICTTSLSVLRPFSLYLLYVCPLGSAEAVNAALRGVRAVICTGDLGHLMPLWKQIKVEHVILLIKAGEPDPGPCLV